MHPSPVRRHHLQGPTKPLRGTALLGMVLTLLSPRVVPALLQPSLPLSLPPLLQPVLALLVALSLGLLLTLLPGPARAQGVELASLYTSRNDGALTLDFVARVTLPKAVEDALQRGVPIYFVAEAQLWRNRWYWRDERVARVSRSWRIAYQPLTGTWRVGPGGLKQSQPTLADALTAASRSSDWKLADLAQLDADKSYYLEFNYRLDTTQLPGPMQFGLGGQGDWAVGASRTIRVDLSAQP